MHLDAADQLFSSQDWIPTDLPPALTYLVVHADNPILLLSTKDEARVDYANPAFLHISGFNKEEIQDQAAAGLLRKLEPSVIPPAGAAIPPTGAEMQIVAKDHQLISCTAVVLPLPGNLLGAQQLVILHLAAAHAVKDRIDYIAMVSHELKTPVTTAKGYAQLLLSMLRAGKAPAESLLRDSLCRLHYQIDRLSALVRSLLEDAELGQGNTGFTPEAVSMDSLLQEVVRDLQFVNPGRNIRLTVANVVSVMADRNKLEQVIINLVNNALKFSPNDRPVDITLELLQNECRLTVSEQGIGIPVGEQSKIFERFYRSPGNGVRGEKGFGLGLFFVKEIVRLHGGSLALESEPGKGSAFFVRLPAVLP